MANKKNIYPCDSFSLPTSALKHLNALLRARLTTVLEISKSLIAIWHTMKYKRTCEWT